MPGLSAFLDSSGEEVEKLVAAIPEGGVLLLENVWFYKEEEKNDPEFAKKLAFLADFYVNDAFGTAHRAHASSEGITKFLKLAVAASLCRRKLIILTEQWEIPKGHLPPLLVGQRSCPRSELSSHCWRRLASSCLVGQCSSHFTRPKDIQLGHHL